MSVTSDPYCLAELERIGRDEPIQCCPWADAPWNKELIHLLHTPTEGQDMTRILFPLTPKVEAPK